jgi:dynein heavy chain 2
LPSIVHCIVWASQTVNKLKETDKLVEVLIGSNSTFLENSGEIQAQVTKFKDDQFSDWCSETQQELEKPDGVLALKRTGRLMDLDYRDGKLRVNYDDRLVTLLRQVRQLVALGLSVPSNIQQTADLGNKYYRHAVVLKQVAHFYNTM